MPSQASITVKKNDGTTDIVYTAARGQGGDQPAVWFGPALGATASTRPELRIFSKPIQNRPNQVNLTVTYMAPYAILNTTTGVTSVERREIARLVFPVDFDVPTANHDEYVSQFVNLLASTHVKAQFKEGAAST